MTHASSYRDLPATPAVYALYGGRGRSLHVAYVGIAGSLRSRIEQHLVRRDSSITTGASVVSLNPELVTRMRWWTRDDFEDRIHLEAAELIAFEVLNPVLRSRGRVTDDAKRLSMAEPFRTEVTELMESDGQGLLEMETLSSVLTRLADVERRLDALERGPSDG